MRKAPPNTICALCFKPIHICASQLARTKNSYCCRQHHLAHRTKPFFVKKGYSRILLPTHPRADAKGYVREHIVIMEGKLSRYIGKTEVIHHIDGNKLNNHPDNLALFTTHSEHMQAHYHISKCP